MRGIQISGPSSLFFSPLLSERHDRRADSTTREFRTSDAMILIAGAALALAGGQGQAHLPTLLAAVAGHLGHQALAHLDDLPENWPAFWAATQEPLRNSVWCAIQVAQMLMAGLTPPSWWPA
jgi:hypothetical protein